MTQGNGTQVQEQEMVVVAARIPSQVDLNYRLEAARRKTSKSDLFREALAFWLDAQEHLCPQCDAPTIPHPDKCMEGVRYCLVCNEPVAYTDNVFNSAQEVKV